MPVTSHKVLSCITSQVSPATTVTDTNSASNSGVGSCNWHRHRGAVDGIGGELINPGEINHILTFDDTSADKSRTWGWEEVGTGDGGRASRRREAIDEGWGGRSRTARQDSKSHILMEEEKL